jgi:plastocyanin
MQAPPAPLRPQAQRRQLLLLALLGAAGWRARAAEGASDAAAEPLTVSISAYRFEPPRLRVRVGSTVRWLNTEKRVSHSVLFGPGGEHAGLESERLLPGDSWQLRFSQPGLQPYRCGPHPEMQGLIEVLAEGAP